MKTRVNPLFDFEKDIVKTVKTIDCPPYSSYYIDETKKRKYILSKDEHPIYQFDTIEEAENWVKNGKS